MAVRRPVRRSRPQAMPITGNRHIAALSVVAIVMSIFAMVISLFALGTSLAARTAGQGSGSGSSSSSGSFGSTTAGIDTPLNASELAVINNANDSYFETAGLMLLNGTLANGVYYTINNVTPYVYNGKVSVLYLGSITCIYCGENRWAMALALGRFGTFSQLYNGYSSFSDYDVPTLYWTQNNYTTSDTNNYNSNGVDIGNSYYSSYINFISIDGNGDITQGFFIQPLNIIGEEVNSTGNPEYIGAYDYLMALQGSNATAFKGTPYTVWGGSVVTGADAVVFGNSTPTGDVLPLTYETHAQVLAQFKNPSDQFAWSEYAAADVYITHVCAAINNTAQICSLSAIRELEALK